MKKTFGATTLVVLAFAFAGVAACGQGDAHPPFLGDCDGCSQAITTGDAAPTDAAKDAAKADASDSGVKDASDGGLDSGVDATTDSGEGGALLDTGTGG